MCDPMPHMPRPGKSEVLPEEIITTPATSDNSFAPKLTEFQISSKVWIKSIFYS